MDNVDDSMRADLSHLNTAAVESVTGLVVIVIEFMIHKKTTSFQSSLEAYAGSGAFASAALKASTRGLIVLFESGMREGWSAGMLHTECCKLGLSEEASTAIRVEWARNAAHIASKLLAKTIAANELVDLDWSFGVTASSSDCDQVGKTYLQMKLSVRNDDEGGGGVRDVFVELSLEQFYALLAQIERCKGCLEAMNKATAAGAGAGAGAPDEESEETIGV